MSSSSSSLSATSISSSSASSPTVAITIPPNILAAISSRELFDFNRAALLASDNSREILKCHSDAISKGKPQALCTLGNYYWQGLGEVFAQDIAQATMLYQLAAFQGHEPARKILGEINTAELSEPILREQTLRRERADKVMELAYCPGDNIPISVRIDAQVRTGMAYYKGAVIPLAIGKMKLPHKKLKGSQFIELASSGLNFPAGLFARGLCFRWGINTTQKLAASVYCFILSAQQGYKLAKTYLGSCYLQGTGLAINRAKAEQYLPTPGGPKPRIKKRNETQIFTAT